MQGYSRGQFLRRGALTAGGLAGVRLLDPLAAFGRPAGEPKPIPGGLKFVGDTIELVNADPDIHVLLPGIGFEMATITDFNGAVGASEIRGTAHDGDGNAYDFDTDMRFMQGVYVDRDGRVHHGSFGFI